MGPLIKYKRLIKTGGSDRTVRVLVPFIQVLPNVPDLSCSVRVGLHTLPSSLYAKRERILKRESIFYRVV